MASKKICRIYNQAELNYLAVRCGYQGDYIGVIYRNTICIYDKLEEMTKRMDNLVARLEQLEEKVNTPNLTR